VRNNYVEENKYQDKGLGRVQLQFDFETKVCDYWFRCMTPDGGGNAQIGEARNRGFSFIPEIKDRVLVGFLGGHPDKPFVMGSLFHGNNAADLGGTKTGNHIKFIRDKSGSEIVMNSEDGSIKLFSKKGNSTVFIDGKRNISISTPDTVSITCTDFKLNTSNSVAINSKPGENGGIGKIDIYAEENIQVNSETADIALTAQESNITMAADNGLFGVSSDETEMSSGGDTTLSAGGVFKITGASDVIINR